MRTSKRTKNDPLVSTVITNNNDEISSVADPCRFSMDPDPADGKKTDPDLNDTLHSFDE